MWLGENSQVGNIWGQNESECQEDEKERHGIKVSTGADSGC